MNTYTCIYNGRTREIMAASLYDAKTAAIAYFRVPKRKQGLVGVYLTELADGTPIQTIPQTY